MCAPGKSPLKEGQGDQGAHSGNIPASFDRSVCLQSTQTRQIPHHISAVRTSLVGAAHQCFPPSPVSQAKKKSLVCE